MGKYDSAFEQIGFQTAFQNELCLKTEVWLYIIKTHSTIKLVLLSLNIFCLTLGFQKIL